MDHLQLGLVPVCGSYIAIGVNEGVAMCGEITSRVLLEAFFNTPIFESLFGHVLLARWY